MFERDIRVSSFLEGEIDIPSEEIFKAIGYLCQWALAGYDRVNVYIAKDGDITASYVNSTTGRRYVIGAVWHGDHYGFHS